MKIDIHSPQFLKTILDHIPDALILLDKDMKIYFVNQSCKTMFNINENARLDGFLGGAIKCKDYKKESPYKCSHCKLTTTIRNAFETKSRQESGSIVLQVQSKEIPGLRLIQYQANYLEFEKNSFVLLKMNDFTKLGDEVIRLSANA